MKRGGRGAVLGHAIGISCLEDDRTRHVQIAYATVVQERNGLAHVCGRTVVKADLHTLTILAPCFDHFAAFPDVVGGGFFHVNVFACLARPDGRQRVPVIRGDNGDGVNLLVFQKYAQVPVGRRLCSGLVLDKLQSGREQRLVGVTDRADAHVVAVLECAPTLEMDGALVAHADDGHVDALVGAAIAA